MLEDQRELVQIKLEVLVYKMYAYQMHAVGVLPCSGYLHAYEDSQNTRQKTHFWLAVGELMRLF